MGLFGGGNSSSSTSNIQETQDNRIAAAQNSSNLQNSRGVINGDVNMLDGGAINSAFDFAQKISDGAANEMAASLGANQDTMMTAMDAVRKAYAGANDNLAEAYQTAKAGDQKIMAMGALVVLAIVAVKVLGKS
ncbi:MAG: hypothetical protein ACXVZR_03790 [Terriglobales bacterium]